VRRKPRLTGGFEGHNAKENTLPGSHTLWVGASQADHWRQGNRRVVPKRLFEGYLRLGSSLKCAASSSPRGEASGFLRRDHPDSGHTISAHHFYGSRKRILLILYDFWVKNSSWNNNQETSMRSPKKSRLERAPQTPTLQVVATRNRAGSRGTIRLTQLLHYGRRARVLPKLCNCGFLEIRGYRGVAFGEVLGSSGNAYSQFSKVPLQSFSTTPARFR
jgi:hypothetical protein